MKEPTTLLFDVKDIPSLNTLYSANQWRRARIAKEAHEAVRYSVLEQLGTDFEPFAVPVSITVRAYMVRPMDVDNTLKCLNDGLVFAGVLVDDNYKCVPELHSYVYKVSKTQQRIEVVIAPLNGG